MGLLAILSGAERPLGKPYETIMELQRRLQCRECDERGKVVVSVRWEMGSAILC